MWSVTPVKHKFTQNKTLAVLCSWLYCSRALMQCAWGCGDGTVLAHPPEGTGSNTCMDAHKNQNIPLPDVQQPVLHFAEQTSPLHHRQTYQTNSTTVLTIHRQIHWENCTCTYPHGPQELYPHKNHLLQKQQTAHHTFLKTAITLLALHRQTPTDSMYFSQSAL